MTTNLNIEFQEEEYKFLLKKKLQYAAKQGREVTWKEVIMQAIKNWKVE
ncbi:MAG: hypothetical protein QXG05_08025 [Nitrososphaerota archaeon]